jgi:hypothetical protein
VRPLGHRIVSAGPEWVTPPDSAEGEPATTQCAVALERFDGVRGTAGIITARGRQQGTERDLIRTHEQNEKRSHQVSVGSGSAELPRGGGKSGVAARQAFSCVSIRSMSAASTEKAAPYASGRIRMTTSAAKSAGSRRVRDNSRSRRFTLLRATADR